jgi:hypothetical protein
MARSLLITAVEAEVTDWIDQRVELVDLKGRRQVVRNGHADPRTIVTGVGPLSIQMPRVHDRRSPESKERFTSVLLPPYLRKAKAMDELIPYLYLLGVSTGDFTEALKALLGPECPGLSAATVTRLVGTWQDEHQAWSRRDLTGKQYVYVWAERSADFSSCDARFAKCQLFLDHHQSENLSWVGARFSDEGESGGTSVSFASKNLRRAWAQQATSMTSPPPARA